MPRRYDDDYGRPSSSRGPPPSQQGNISSSNWRPLPAYQLDNPPETLAQNAPSRYGYPIPNAAPESLPPPPASVEDLGFPETASKPLDKDFPASEYTEHPDYVRGRYCEWISREWSCDHMTYEFRVRCWNHAGSTVRCPQTGANTWIQDRADIPCPGCYDSEMSDKDRKDRDRRDRGHGSKGSKHGHHSRHSESSRHGYESVRSR